eukprot:gene4623-5663_t
MDVRSGGESVRKGRPCVVDAAHLFSIFTLAESGLQVNELRLENLHLQRGYATASSGGALNLQPRTKAILAYSILENNAADIHGGAISANPSASVELSQCNITGNYAGAYGGGIAAVSTGVATTFSTEITLSYVNLQRNNATAGGAIFAYRSLVLIRSSSVIRNIARDGSGGGVHAVLESHVVVTQSSIQDNLSIRSGGGIFVGDGSTLNPDHITQTAGSLLLLTNSSTCVHNTAMEYGGGIKGDPRSDVTVSYSSSVSENIAEYGGGGIDVHYESSVTVSEWSNVDSNYAGSVGGGISAYYDGVVVVTQFSSVDGNHAVDNGGSLLLHPGVRATVSISSSIRHNRANGDGGGIFALRGNAIHIEGDCSVSFNRAGQNGGGLSGNYQSNLNLNGSWLQGNHASAAGGGLFFRKNSRMELYQALILNCSTHGFGGGLAMSYFSSAVLWDGSLVQNNTGFSGGGIFVEYSSSITVINSSIQENRAWGYQGGGVAIQELSNITLSQGTILQGNEAQYRGGGLVIMVRSRAVARLACKILGNRALENNGGGAFITDESFFLLSSSRLYGNSAKECGGGVYLSEGSEAHVTRSVLGAVAACGLNGTIAQRTSSAWRALSADDVFGGEEGNAVTENQVGSGGGLYAKDSHVVVVNSSVCGNAAPLGGAFRFAKGSSFQLQAVACAGNRAFDAGGCMHLAGEVGLLQAQDLPFYNNSAITGGAIYMEVPHSIVNATWHRLSFAQNHARGLVFWAWDIFVIRDPFHTCTQCVSEDGAWPFTTTPRSFQAIWPGTGENISEPIISESWATIPVMQYVSRDFYGNISQVSSTDSIVITVTLISANSNDGSYLKGTTLYYYYSGYGAEVDSLKVVGMPGALYTIRLEPSDPAWSVVSIQVRLSECQPGQVYSEKTLDCTWCKKGFVKFSNSTQPCAECAESGGLFCPGGGNFTLRDEYWMPSAWTGANCATDEALPDDCLMSRVYQCKSYTADGCRAAKGWHRSNEEGAPSIATTALCDIGCCSTLLPVMTLLRHLDCLMN